jgi:hypothetical protein
MGSVPVAEATASSHSIAIEMPAAGVHVVVSSKSRDGGRSPGSSAPIAPRKKLAWAFGSESQWKKWYAERTTPALFIAGQFVANSASVKLAPSVALAIPKAPPLDLTSIQSTFPS